MQALFNLKEKKYAIVFEMIYDGELKFCYQTFIRKQCASPTTCIITVHIFQYGKTAPK